MLHDRDRRDALELYAADAAADFRLDLRLWAHDPHFSDCTEPATARQGAILAFDAWSATPDPADGSYRLSAGEHVSEDDFVPLDSERAASALTPRDLLVPPVALVRLQLADADGALLVPDPEGDGRRYRLDFRARRAYWRYLLLGELAGESVTISDLDGDAGFTSGGRETLPGDRRALSFRSTGPIPLRERSDRRFQLRLEAAEGSENGRLLIRRLPVATPAGLRRETIDGEAAFVSDIYVNA